MSSSSINALLPTWAEPWTNLTLILAGWPQAKGRIERLWGTFQDRLVSELRLAKAKTLEQAQAVLDRYLPEHNRKFSNPAQAQPAWRKASAQQIEQALCFKEKRTVANDNTITFDGVLLRSLRNLPIAPTPIRELTCMCFWTAQWSFSINKKKSLRLTLKKRTHVAYIEGTRSQRGSAMDLFPIDQPTTSNSLPDIFTLLLT